MTTKPNSVVEALEQAKHWLEKERESKYGTWGVAENLTLNEIEKALPIAIRQAEAEAELVRYKGALEWIIREQVLLDEAFASTNMPTLIRELIEKKGEL